MLTALQTKFVLEYCKDLDLEGTKPNQTDAARRAGCPPAGAHVTATRWLQDPKIQAAIKELPPEKIAAVLAAIGEQSIKSKLWPFGK